jgi:hypothetical protein
MVHNCIVPGCANRSNKLECKRIKFYTVPKAKKLLQTWLSLIGRRLSEISLHSRICSQHFIDGIKDSVPQVFPWQKRSATTSAPTHAHILSPTDIVYHDHTYFAQPPDLPSTHLTPLLESSVALSPFTLDVSTQISSSHFCIEDIADDDTAVHFYTGFSDYRTFIICFEFLGKAVYHLKYLIGEINLPFHRWKNVVHLVHSRL